MSSRSKFARIPRVFASAALLALVQAPAVIDAASKPLAFNKPLGAFDAAAVGRAKAGAVKKLRDPECLKILTDFEDGEGRTLDRNLAPWGMSAADYLDALAFRDGAALALCARKSIQMLTSPGLPPVYVCPAGVGALNSRFAQVEMETPFLAEAMVIHEMLHSLGLGENPPSTFEITERVRTRCR